MPVSWTQLPAAAVPSGEAAEERAGAVNRRGDGRGSGGTRGDQQRGQDQLYAQT
jgi:hypothetical protein